MRPGKMDRAQSQISAVKDAPLQGVRRSRSTNLFSRNDEKGSTNMHASFSENGVMISASLTGEFTERQHELSTLIKKMVLKYRALNDHDSA